jgi:hypothetical protein
MTNSTYLDGRRKYGAPQAMLWSENPGTLANGFYYPDGYEVGANTTGVANEEQDTFLILSDHNRSELSFASERIQNRLRMINGNMRAYNIADKIAISTSWQMLPSKSFKFNPNFNSTGQQTIGDINEQYTIDGGAGGLQLLDWYNFHQGPFWVFLAYDQYADKTKYNQIVQMYFKDFSYSVVKRNGPSRNDLWNINITLEEV